MKLHANAALVIERASADGSLGGRAGLVAIAEPRRPRSATRTCSKWVARYRAEGEAGAVGSLQRPAARRQPHRRARRSQGSRRCDGCGSPARRSPSCSTCRSRRSSGILTRIGMGKLGRLGLEPAERYERERPGELIHIDVKKLGRIQGGAGKRVHAAADQRLRRGDCTDAAGVPRGTAAGTPCTSRSTTPPAWPTPRCCATRRRPPRSGSCAARSRSSPATASPSSA